MFTPEGYWSWHETIDEASLWTLEIVMAQLSPQSAQALATDPSKFGSYKTKMFLLSQLVESGKVDNLVEAQFSLDLLKLWVLANFMDTYDAVLCSPTGITLRCPPLLKAHGDAFDWWIWPLDKEKMSNGEASTYFRSFREHGFSIQDAQNRFCAIDYESGGIRLKVNTRSLLDSASYGHSASEDGLEQFIEENIRPIVGWSICWNPEDLPETRQDLYDSLGFKDLDWATFNGASQSVHSSSQGSTHVLECVKTAFPNGKGSATWPVVEEKVGYSRRSIVRALKKDGQYSDWASDGRSQ